MKSQEILEALPLPCKKSLKIEVPFKKYFVWPFWALFGCIWFFGAPDSLFEVLLVSPYGSLTCEESGINGLFPIKFESRLSLIGSIGYSDNEESRKI